MGTVEYEFERQDHFGYYIQPAIMATTKNMVTFLAIAFQLMVFSNALPQGLLGKLFNRRVGSDPCTRGPAHWCASIENIFECGIGAYQHCKREREQQNTPALLGQDAPLDHLTGVRVSIQSLNAVTGHMSIAKKIETQPQ